SPIINEVLSSIIFETRNIITKVKINKRKLIISEEFLFLEGGICFHLILSLLFIVFKVSFDLFKFYPKFIIINMMQHDLDSRRINLSNK
ncbi:hypothetical protein LCGC14_1512040, partial [marine sediment metagenome]